MIFDGLEIGPELLQRYIIFNNKFKCSNFSLMSLINCFTYPYKYKMTHKMFTTIILTIGTYVTIPVY